MKLHSLSAVLCLAFSLSMISCGKKSDKSDPQDAAAVVDDPALCAAIGAGHLHGDLTGFIPAEAKQFYVKVEWLNPLKSSTLENKAKVTFVNGHAQALALRLSSFTLFSPTMGHGSSRLSEMVMTQDAANPNVWNVENIYFSMAGAVGDWVVDVEAGACGITDKARVEIPVAVEIP
ncbi:hypothetical protein [Oligoflexus tunisiensis]|uniref:hypothetical protein n=1 Tax=Oligoflexus tunisiensis TaxID=708132 RepID=UPI00114D0CA7|nr:hypothetical protein [Oligoflexus tunisiensis]